MLSIFIVHSFMLFISMEREIELLFINFELLYELVPYFALIPNLLQNIDTVVIYEFYSQTLSNINGNCLIYPLYFLHMFVFCFWPARSFFFFHFQSFSITYSSSHFEIVFNLPF